MTLSRRDESELKKMLSMGQFFKSTMGPQLDRLWLYSVRSRQTEPLTARITSESREQAKADPDWDQVEVYGRASGRLQRVIERNPRWAAALISLYGDDGEKVQTSKYGRLSAIFHLTEAGGKKLAKQTGPKLNVSPVQRIQNALNAQDLQPLIERGALIQRVMVQAIELRELAEAAYSATGAERARR